MRHFLIENPTLNQKYSVVWGGVFIDFKKPNKMSKKELALIMRFSDHIAKLSY
jgi:hypothetical protein